MSSVNCDRFFGHVDCDNFYVSCERVFRPDLKSRPVVILSNNDGVIVSRSPEAKALGIKMGVPFHKAKDIIKQHAVAVFSSNYELYADMSHRVMKTLRTLAPDVEMYSIDEAFLIFDKVGDEHIGDRIRATVLQHTGIPVTIGIGRTRTLAKLAVEYSKQKRLPTNCLNLNCHPDPDNILRAIASQDVWGIGVQIARWLYLLGVKTAYDLKNFNDRLMKSKTGITGLRTVYELRGISCVQLRDILAPRKGVLSSRSFGRYVTELDDLRESVASHAARAAEKLRMDGSVAGELSVFITTNVYAKNPQYANTARLPIIPSSNASHDFVRLAQIGLLKIYLAGFRYIKAGVRLDKITPADQRQVDIFQQTDWEKNNRLYSTVDRLNRRFGTSAVRIAACGIQQDWAMRRDFSSPRYTTRLEDVPVACTNQTTAGCRASAQRPAPKRQT